MPRYTPPRRWSGHSLRNRQTHGRGHQHRALARPPLGLGSWVTLAAHQLQHGQAWCLRRLVRKPAPTLADTRALMRRTFWSNLPPSFLLPSPIDSHQIPRPPPKSLLDALEGADDLPSLLG